MRVAIFDFDGTLYPQETFNVMMNFMKNHPVHKEKFKGFYRSLYIPYFSYKLKLYPERKMKADSMFLYAKAFQHLTKQAYEAYFAEMAMTMRDQLNSKVVERLQQHIENGDKVLVVSGAFTMMLKEIFKQYALDHVIGTEIPFSDDKFDGSKGIYHIQAERKNEMIDEALRGQTIDWDNSYAYGDSISDISVLERVGFAVAVRPEPRLKAIAQERNWEILL